MSMSAGALSHHGDTRITRSAPPCSAITGSCAQSHPATAAFRRMAANRIQIEQAGHHSPLCCPQSHRARFLTKSARRPHSLCSSKPAQRMCKYRWGQGRFLSCVQAGMWQTWWRHCVHKVAFTVAKCGEHGVGIVVAKVAWQEWWRSG